MSDVDLILLLMVAVAAIVGLSRRTPVPYPVFLVVGGLILALIPGVPVIELRPDIVFLLFLPPLLFWESVMAPLRDFRVHAAPILLLAFGLVLVTTAAVAWVAHSVIPGFSWPIAFVLGAVLAPTDEVAVAEVAKRIAMPRSALAVLEGESLINDAISLVAYRMAIVAAVAGRFSLGAGAVQFLEVCLGGAAIGLAVGWAIVWLRIRLDTDPSIENIISLLTPFAAYLPAERLGVSGVLAVVAAGLYIGRRGPRFISSRTRLQAVAMWEMLTFVVNGLLFILTGMQLRLILRSNMVSMLPAILGYSAAVVATLLVVRFLWVIAYDQKPLFFKKKKATREERSWAQTLLIGWTGIRGSLSLVTALAIPLTLSNAAPFPNRQLIISITFCVILFTLVLQGWTLPWVVRRLRFRLDLSDEQEEALACLEAARAAMKHLDSLARKPASERRTRQSGGATTIGIDDDRLEACAISTVQRWSGSRPATRVRPASSSSSALSPTFS